MKRVSAKSQKPDKKRRKIGLFWKIYAALVLVAVAAIGITWFILWSFLSAYEKAQPNHTVEYVVEKLNHGDINYLKEYVHADISAVQDQEAFESYLDTYLSAYIAGGEWDYIKKSSEYTKNSPVYQLRKNQDAQMTVHLKMKEERNAFNTPQWEIEKMEGILGEGNTIRITVPKGSEVTVNHVVLDSTYISSDDVPNENLGNVQKYIEVPLMTVYTVDKLYTDAEVSAKGPVYGEELEMLSDDGGDIKFAFEGNSEEIVSQEDRIKNISTIYGKYVTNDVRFSALAPYILKSSYAYTYLSGLSKTNVWFTEHTAVEFRDMRVYHYQVFTENCFSCEVEFNQVVYRSSKEYSYPTHITYVFIKDKGKWYVADMSLKDVS